MKCKVCDRSLDGRAAGFCGGEWLCVLCWRWATGIVLPAIFNAAQFVDHRRGFML